MRPDRVQRVVDGGRVAGGVALVSGGISEGVLGELNVAGVVEQVAEASSGGNGLGSSEGIGVVGRGAGVAFGMLSEGDEPTAEVAAYGAGRGHLGRAGKAKVTLS